MTALQWPRELRSRAPATAVRSATIGPIVLALIVLAGVGVRVGLPTFHHAWAGISEFDDGVHLGAAQLLFAGHLPYRDFAFLQPPGIALLLQPVAALAKLIGDDEALVVARAIFVAIGVLNICLLWKLLRARGRVAAATAAAFYALWLGTVSTERTILLEPLLNLGLLATLLILRRSSPRAVLLSGVVLGLSCTVKLWPLVFLPVLAVWLWRTGGIASAARFVAAAIGSFGVVIAPFWILAGSAFPHQVLFAQSDRARSVAPLSRLQSFDGIAWGSQLQHSVPGAFVVVVALAFLAVALRLARRDREVALWLGLLVVGGISLWVAPSFYYHYPAFLAVPLAAILASFAAALRKHVSIRVWRFVAALGLTVALAFGVSSAQGGWDPQPVRHSVGAATASRCVWSSQPILLITINHFSDQTGCGYVLDGAAVYQAYGQRTADRTYRSQFLRAGAALLLWGGPRDQQPAWTPATVGAFLRRFRRVENLPTGISVWKARAG